MKKRLVNLLLCLVLAFGLMPAAVFAETNEALPLILTPGSDTVAEPLELSDEPIGDFMESDPFSDVAPDDWFYDDVIFAVTNGLMNGVGEGLFSPNGNITRGMIATIIYRLEGEPAFMNENVFTDVPVGSYYERAIIWCSSGKADIARGYGDGRFGPDDSITREQLATMLYNYACYKEHGFADTWMFYLNFPDSDSVSDWAYDAMCWCVMNGFINGMDSGKLEPQGTATRAQAARILSLYSKKFDEDTPSPATDYEASFFVGDFRNDRGDRISFDDNGDGSFTVNARIVPGNPLMVDGMWGYSYLQPYGMEIDVLDPSGNHTTAQFVPADRKGHFTLIITGSMWDAVKTGERFEGFVKYENI